MAYTPAGSMTFFRPPCMDDLDGIHAIEAASYPEDEAASREKLQYRIEQAPGQFLVAVQSAASPSDGADALVGFVCGTLSTASGLTHESMSTHEPGGRLLCVHSVAVAEPQRRQGIASRLLRAYLPYVAGTTPGLREVRLICKQHLIPLYEKAGFVLLGPSAVEHGADRWHEMRAALEQQEQQQQQQLPEQ